MTEKPEKVVSTRYRVLAAIGIPLLGMILVDPAGALNPRAIELIPYYPLGFTMGLTENRSVEVFAIFGYLAIGGLMAWTFAVPWRRPFCVVCGFLALTCALTTNGC